MERELMLTGIGGQGVQLAAQVIARAATLEGRSVMFFGVYSGAMRGGNTDSTVVVSDTQLDAPPIIARTWSAIAMHHEYWEPMHGKLRDGSVLFVNSTLFEGEIDPGRFQVFEVPATEIAATELDNLMTASMVMTGAYVGITGLVSIDSAIAAMAASLPSYRQQHIALNERALRAGFDRVDKLAAPAWAGDAATTGVAR
jgi:Pyruvate/2-oxoacid:ferredoxin oxidoreductase gamma subunit